MEADNTKNLKYINELETRFSEIDKLIFVPHSIQEFALHQLHSLSNVDLTTLGHRKVGGMITAMKNIEDVSIREAFKIIYNQVCILAVSALSTVLEKYFINFINANWNKINLSEEKTKISFSELAEYDFNLKSSLGNVILEKFEDINLQDLQSIVRSFEKYCGKKISPANKTQGSVIFYQQARHLLVHRDGIVDEEFLKKVGVYNFRLCKLGDRIEFDKSDWDLIRNSFSELVRITVDQKSDFDLYDLDNNKI